MRPPRLILPVVLALLAFGAVEASAHQQVAVGTKTMRVHGKRVQMLTHGDRGIPAGSDRGLRRLARRAALRSVRSGAMAFAAAAAPVLESAWCGVETTVDDTANAAATSGPRYKVVYAYPSDQPDRFPQYASLIQGDMRAISDVVVAASGGTKGIRFDVGTVCGNGFVDIVSVRLAHTRGQFLGATFSDRVSMIRDDIAAAFGPVGANRNELIYADGLYGSDGIAGVGAMWLDDSPGPANTANSGGLTAIVFGSGGGDPDFAPDTRRQSTALHEISHNLGAVQDSAPHATGLGHCTDLDDVMCYADGGPNNVLTHPCADATPSPYDCGKDDYFNPAPALGSYLATHWNLYDVSFLCGVGNCIRPGGNSPPTAALRVLDGSGAEVTSATPGTSVVLDGGGSSDAQGDIASWSWEVGGPVTTTRSGRIASVTLPAAGTYSIRLTVTDGDGAPASTTATITVAAAASDAVAAPPAAAPPAVAPLGAPVGTTTAPAQRKPAAKKKTAKKKPAAKKKLTAGQKRRIAAKRRAVARRRAAARTAVKRRAAARRRAMTRRR